jgi:hypothetical protein
VTGVDGTVRVMPCSVCHGADLRTRPVSHPSYDGCSACARSLKCFIWGRAPELALGRGGSPLRPGLGRDGNHPRLGLGQDRNHPRLGLGRDGNHSLAA